MTVPPSYTDPGVVADIKNSAASSGNDYKAIVTIFFYGGIDTHNILLPTGTNPNLSIYEDMRDEGVRIEQDEINDVLTDNANLSVAADGSWGLHPNLPVLKSLWDDGDLCFIHDVGILNKPTTKTDYLDNEDEYQPVSIFSHNDQQNQWMAALPFGSFLETGWFGRVGNLYDPYYPSDTEGPIFNPDQTVDSGVITTIGQDIQSKPYPPLNNVNYPPTLYTTPHVRGVVDQTDMNAADLKLRHDDPGGAVPLGTNLMVNSFIEIYNNSVESQEETNDNAWTWEDDPSVDQSAVDRINDIFDSRVGEGGTFVYSAKQVAEILYSSKAPGYNQRRQTIFAGTGGWDHHANLRSSQDPKLIHVNAFIEALVEFLKDPAVDMYDDVVVMHESEFSRTLSSNNTAGTDHAWASHTFAFGGPIKGGIYPTNYTPDYDPSGIKSDGSTLGRYIPEVSVEMYYAEILEWFGVPRKHLDLVLPALPLYTTDSNHTTYIFANKPNGTDYSIDFI